MPFGSPPRVTPPPRFQTQASVLARLLPQPEQRLPHPLQQALAMADPSEPKYCHCQRISFGEMIACENQGRWAGLGAAGAGAAGRQAWHVFKHCIALQLGLLSPSLC